MTKSISKFSIIFATLILAGGVMVGYSYFQSDSSSNTNSEVINQTGFDSVDVPKFRSLMQQPDSFLIDVHTPEQTHLPGTDAVIAYDQITAHSDQLPSDKNQPILVYCRSGSMSKTASQALVDLGYNNVYDLQGGLNAYLHQINEVSVNPSSQSVGTVIYGDVATTEFTLTNFTAEPLTVTRLSTSCSCTSAQMASQVVPANSSQQIKVSFDPAVHNDNSDLGDITRTIYIETNHPSYPKLEVTITGTVIKES